MTTLDARNLTVEFRQRGAGVLRAVDDVSFAIDAGRTLALVGESGSGKSTVVRSLAGLQRLTHGSVVLDGRLLRHRPAALRAYRRQVQTVFQDPFASLNPAHSIAHHLARPLRIYHRAGRNRDALRAAVLDLLRSVNLSPPEDVADRKPHELSGGQRQRVAIARALAPEPSVLLADEPVSMLDVSVRLEILNLLAGLERERNLAMLYVTHDLATARHFSNDVLVLYRGRVVERGSTDNVILQPAHPYTQLLAGAIPDPTMSKAELAEARAARSRARTVRRPAPAPESGDTGCAFAPRCPYVMDRCVTDTPPELPVRDTQTARCWLYGDAHGGDPPPVGRSSVTTTPPEQP